MNAGARSLRSRRDLRRAERHRRRELELGIATYVSAADRSDLAAILDRFDDTVTRELHDLLLRQEAQAERRSRPIWRAVEGY